MSEVVDVDSLADFFHNGHFRRQLSDCGRMWADFSGHTAFGADDLTEL